MTRLVIFTAAWVGGILLAQAARFPQAWLTLCLPASLILWFGWRQALWARRLAAILIGILLGASRLAFSQLPLPETHIATYNDRGAVTLIGIVTQEPDQRSTHTQVTLRATQISPADGTVVAVEGRVLARLPAHTQIRYGDELEITGDLVTPPESGDFSYRQYLAQRGIYSLLRAHSVRIRDTHKANALFDLVLQLKARSHAILLTSLPEPQASLLSGILLGVESGIPTDLNDAFRITGTSHIVAISGFNLTLIAGVFSALALRTVGRRYTLPVALVGIWSYTVLVGASAAVVRAAVMASLVIIASREHRRVHGPTSLAGAVLLMSLLNPFIIWDVGFQLSLAATLGLMLYTPALTQGFTTFLHRLTTAERAQQIVAWLGDTLIVTLAAQITTTPILAARFGRLSLISLLTNLLVLPAQPSLMLFGGITVLGGLVALPVARVLAWLAWVFLSYTIGVVRLAAALPHASIDIGGIAPSLVWGYYGILALITGWISAPQEARRRLWQRLRGLPSWQTAMAIASVVLVAVAFASFPDGRLHITFLDVGLGDATLIRTPGGRTILIDGGPNGPRTLAQLGGRLPFWQRALDLVILTSPDAGRIEGLIPVLERYTVNHIAVGAESGTSPAFRHWQELLDALPADRMQVVAADVTWHLDAGIELRVLWPPADGNPGPLVLQLVYGDTRVLFGGDATTLVEEALVSAYGENLRSQVLHVPRHAAQTAATPAFLQAVSPTTVIISAEAGSAYPSPYALARLMDAQICRTDTQGAIEVTSDGRTIRIRADRR